MKGKEIFVKIL